jgi:hypothetical protein
MSRVANPGLHVALSVKPIEDVMGPDDAVAVHVDVVEAAKPLRVSIYVDGDLVDTWVPTRTGYQMQLPGVRGRHVVTARAIDAQGRWGGASTLVDLTSHPVAAALPV